MRRSLFALATFACVAYAPAQTFLGPTPYLQFADSPWVSETFDYFHLETVEDHLFNTPGATLAGGSVTSSMFGLSSLVDSVDEDDGSVNGTNGFNGTFGDSLFHTGTIIIAFNEGVLGTLPTHAGLVWTDGAGTVTFEAFDSLGVSLGTSTGSHADPSTTGATAEDRFYGVIHTGGISRIEIRNSGGALETDHVQYGAVPEPGTLAALGLGAAAFLRRRRAR